MASAPPATTPGTRRLNTLGKVARAALIDEVLSKLRAVLDDDLVALLVDGWQEHAVMMKAARESLGDPGAERTVVLAKHSITSRHSPQLKVEVDGYCVLTLSTSCELVFQVMEAVAIVRDGRLTELRSGHCEVSGIVAIEGQEIAQRRLQLPLTADLRLRSGLTLIRPAD